MGRIDVGLPESGKFFLCIPEITTLSKSWDRKTAVYSRLRHADGGAAIRDLDGEFVWEVRLGRLFTKRAYNWKLSRITHNDVFVLHVNAGASAPLSVKPRKYSRAFNFSRAMGRFLEPARRASTIPIKENEEIIGVFFGVPDLKTFSRQFVDAIKTGASGCGYVVDDNGLVIAHPDKTRVLETNI